MSHAIPPRGRFRFAVLAAAFSILVPLLLCTAGAADPGQVTPDEEHALAARGSVTYRVYCASCHGRQARGEGRLADLLEAEPANLTLIGWRNQDTFPADHVYRAIDGRNAPATEGRREMPVWGEALGATEEAAGLPPERIEEKIWELVYYLKSIQSPGA